MAHIDVVGDIVRVTSAAVFPLGTGGQQIQEWNLSYICRIASGGDTRQALGVLIDAINVARLVPLLSTDASYYGVKVSNLGYYPPPVAVTAGAPTAGTGAATQTPTQCRGLVSWKTGLGGRTGRGRVYLPSPDASGNSATGSPAAAYLAAINNWAVDVLTPQVAAGTTWELVVAHRGTGPQPAYTATGVTLKETKDIWATQRRSGESGRVNVFPW